jgi:hyperosmotically inducible protein
MVRALLKLIVLMAVIFVVGAFMLGWWSGGGWIRDRGGRPVGTTGIDTSKAREVGAEVSQKAAKAAAEAGAAIEEGSLTAKIKAKMALDDKVHANDINVDTKDGVVTLSGDVSSEMEHQRAVLLARETNGVRSVVDKLRVVVR